MQPQDLLRADPAEFRVAIGTERIFFDHSPNMTAFLRAEATENEQTLFDERFDFVDTTDRDRWLLDEPESGDAWRVYSLGHDQLDRFRQMQKRLESLSAFGDDKPPGRNLSLAVLFDGEGGIDENGNLVDGARPLPPGTMQRWAEDGLLMDVVVRPDRETGFLVLFRNFRLPVEIEDSAIDQ